MLNNYRNAGFSMIELMIVLLIISITAGVAFTNSNFSSVGTSAQIREMTDKLRVDIAYARNLAVIEGFPVEILPVDDTTGSQRLSNSPDGVNWAQGWEIWLRDGSPEGILMRQQGGFDERAQIRSVDDVNIYDKDNPIRFDDTGRLRNFGTLHIGVLGCIGPSAKELRISGTGQVSFNELPCSADSYTGNGPYPDNFPDLSGY